MYLKQKSVSFTALCINEFSFFSPVTWKTALKELVLKPQTITLQHATILYKFIGFHKVTDSCNFQVLKTSSYILRSV